MSFGYWGLLGPTREVHSANKAQFSTKNSKNESPLESGEGQQETRSNVHRKKNLSACLQNLRKFYQFFNCDVE